MDELDIRPSVIDSPLALHSNEQENKVEVDHAVLNAFERYRLSRISIFRRE